MWQRRLASAVNREEPGRLFHFAAPRRAFATERGRMSRRDIPTLPLLGDSPQFRDERLDPLEIAPASLGRLDFNAAQQH